LRFSNLISVGKYRTDRVALTAAERRMFSAAIYDKGRLVELLSTETALRKKILQKIKDQGIASALTNNRLRKILGTEIDPKYWPMVLEKETFKNVFWWRQSKYGHSSSEAHPEEWDNIPTHQDGIFLLLTKKVSRQPFNGDV
jgi:hypothetical protein